MLTSYHLAIAARWADADLKLAEMYNTMLPATPARVVVRAGGRSWLVELRREFFEGQSRVFARRLRVVEEGDAV